MKPGALYLLICALILAAIPPADTAGLIRPTAIFYDDFDDTSQLDTVDTLTAQGGYLQVPAQVTWQQDTQADFYPGTGSGVDLLAQPGSVVLARFSPDRRVNDIAAGRQDQVDAAFSPYLSGREDVPYLYAAWADGRSGDMDIYFARSTDGGYTWSAGRKLNLLDDAGDQRAPALAASGGYIHAAWEDDVGVHYARSEDYGSNWVTDLLLAAGGSAPDVAATQAGGQPVAYLLYAAEESPGDPGLYARRSANGGLSWGTPEYVTAGAPAGAAQHAPALLLPAGLDAPWAAWEDGRGGDWDIYANRRSGGIWMANQRVDAGPAGSAQLDPVLFCPTGAALPHVLWADDRGSAAEIYEARYDGDTLIWSELGHLTNGAAAGAPAAAAFAAYSWAAWPARAHDTIQAARNNGAAWEEPLTAADHRPGAARSTPAVAQAALDGVAIAVLWSDDRAGDEDIYVATSDGSYWVTGVYTSPVHEFGAVAAWGAIVWTGTDLDNITVEARSGATPAPDAGWSPWAAAANGATLPAPPARYTQYRARLDRTAIGTPALDGVQVTAYPGGGVAVSTSVGHCVAAWDEFTAEGYAPTGTTLTLSVLDVTGSVLYAGVATPFDLSAIPVEQYGRLRLRVDMARSPADTPVLNWWQVTWEEGQTHAAFSFEPPIVYTPTVVVFTNLSTATVAPMSLTWALGDGITSTAEHPTHTYALPGAYTVTLQAAGECGVDTAVAAVTVIPLPLVSPTAAFSYGPLCVDAPVSFTNESLGAIWWGWNLGDGSASARLHPTHTYTASGDYTVTLVVTNTRGSDREAQRLPVRPAPTAAFSWTTELLTVAFSATVGGDPELAWTFGDGFTSTLAQPVHRYAASGDYSVTLAAENGCGAATVVEIVSVYCAPAAALGLNWAPPIPAPGQEVALTVEVTGSEPLSLSWTFGDGGTGQGTHVTHAYAAAGLYTVTLRAENACGVGMVAAAIAVETPVYRAFLPALYARDYYAGDAYEDDDTPDRARLLTLDDPQRRDFAPGDDVDWVYLELTAGVTYYFSTYDLAGGADTVLSLHPAGAAEPLLENDDCTGQTLASCLTFTPAAAGRYELRVRNIAGLWGPAVAYTLAGRMQ